MLRSKGEKSLDLCGSPGRKTVQPIQITFSLKNGVLLRNKTIAAPKQTRGAVSLLLAFRAPFFCVQKLYISVIIIVEVVIIMENQDSSQVLENQTQPHIVELNDTAIVEYLDIVKSEYENERNKKQSFENRAGLIMALLGAICIFLFEKVQLKEIFSFMVMPLTFLDFIKIISGLAVYIGFLFTMIMIIKTIIVKQHNNLEVKSINETLLAEQRIVALCKLIFTYRDIILQHRELNEKRAKAFRKSLYGISITLISVIIYITLI